MGIITIGDDSQFQSQFASNGTKLMVVDFTASWCGPCIRMGPVFERYSVKYPNAVFLKVDVDICPETAAAQGVSSMPTFVFYRNRVKIDRISGADPTGLEDKIIQHYDPGSPHETYPTAPGHMDLAPFIKEKDCEALNEDNNNPLANCLKKDDSYLESSCDNQLLISISFAQVVKIHSIKMKAPEDCGPKTVKIYTNVPNTIGFDEATNNTPVQTLEMKPEDLVDGNVVNLRFVKFQSVQHILLFVQDNQDGSDTTRIERLQFIGSPVSTTNMNDFKRMDGKKGEGHF